METIIQIKHLYKSFKDVKAVQDLSFKVKRGELFAFLGENGAGKSTTISIMCGCLSKDSGEVFVNGVNLDKNVEAIKKEIGVVFQNSVLDKALSVRENLEHRASLYGIHGQAFEKRLEELGALLDFKDLFSRAVGKLSGGQRRRVDIARALLHNPNILILDEPTTGLDPQTRKLLWNIVNGLRKTQNMTVFLTTHYMEEATEADYVVILDHGKIAAEGTPLALKNEYTGDCITVYNVSEKDMQSLGVPFEKSGSGYKIFVANTAKATELIVKNSSLFVDYEIIKGKMDDVFLAVTGKSLTGDEQK